MVHIAKTTGAEVVSDPVSRWPWFLTQAITKGLQVESWMEHLPPDEMPPQEIWHHAERLDAWFERIKAEREAKYKTAPNGDPYENVPGTESVEFDVADELRELRS